MGNPFKDNAQKYIESGFSVIPLVYREKYPIIRNWSRYNDKPMKAWQADEYKEQYNIGLCLGKGSGVIALDFDYNIEDMHGEIFKIIPKSEVGKIGEKGVTLFYRYNGERTRKWTMGGTTVLELLSDGRQTVVPPSIHPKGMEYRWQGISLLDYDKEDLPIITEGMIDDIDKLFGIDLQKEVIQTNENCTTLEEVKDALAFIDPDCSYEEWLYIGMAIHNFTGGNSEGLSVWDEWSSRGAKYQENEDNNSTERKWNSFNSEGITISTLIKKAIENGYIHLPDYSSWDVSEMLSCKTKEVLLPNELCNAPGLVGEIAEHINETALYKQPILSLAAAIGLAGTIYAHKIKSDTDLRTNMYTMAIAHTGTGKNHPRIMAHKILMRVGMASHIMGEPASGSGILSALDEAGGIGLMLIDEMGKFLDSISGNRTAKYLQEINKYTMELFSSANIKYIGKEYADKKTNQRIDINQPNMSINGFTTPERFYDALTSKEVLDGFLPRWILLESKELPDKKRKNRRDMDDIPLSLLQRIEDIKRRNEELIRSRGGGFVSQATGLSAELVDFDDKAQDILDEYENEILKKRKKAIKEYDPIDSIYARAVEHVIKLCLIANEDYVITEKVINWAIGIINYNIDKIDEVIDENLSSSKHEDNINYVLSAIKRIGKWVTKSEITRKTQKLNPKERNEALNDLVESGRVKIKMGKVNDSQKPAQLFRV